MATLVPHDLYRHILSNLAPHDLCAVATASRALHHETTHLLYRDVDLHKAFSPQLLSWAYAVSDNPNLSALVRTLCLPSLNTVLPEVRASYDQAEVARAFTRAFGAIVNLVSLRLDLRSFDVLMEIEMMEHYLQWEYLMKSTFRLRLLHIVQGHTLFEPRGLISFLSNQPDLEDWTPTTRNPFPEESITQDMLSTSLLPRLAIFKLAYRDSLDIPLLKFATSRPLVRLCLSSNFQWHDDDSPFTDIMAVVYQCRHTLLHFRLEGGQDALPPVKVIETISQCLPGLKSVSLRWAHRGGSSMMDNLNPDQVVQLTAALSKFTRLENLLVECTSYSEEEAPQNLAKRPATTQQIFKSCVTLKCLTFFETSFSRNMRVHSALRVHYRRHSDGTIILEEGAGGLDHNSWREL